MTAREIIELLDLEPLSFEGGFYRRTLTSRESLSMGCLPSRYQTPRPFYTCIYYLITPESFSSLHKLRTDEIFHFYLGDPVRMLQLHENGKGEIIKIGTDLKSGEQPQVRVPQNTWQGARLERGGKFALLGVTVAPGFDLDDFTAGNAEDLVERYPEFAGEIVEL